MKAHKIVKEKPQSRALNYIQVVEGLIAGYLSEKVLFMTINISNLELDCLNSLKILLFAKSGLISFISLDEKEDSFL